MLAWPSGASTPDASPSSASTRLAIATCRFTSLSSAISAICASRGLSIHIAPAPGAYRKGTTSRGPGVGPLLRWADQRNGVLTFLSAFNQTIERSACVLLGSWEGWRGLRCRPDVPRRAGSEGARNDHAGSVALPLAPNVARYRRARAAVARTSAPAGGAPSAAYRHRARVRRVAGWLSAVHAFVAGARSPCDHAAAAGVAGGARRRLPARLVAVRVAPARLRRAHRRRAWPAGPRAYRLSDHGRPAHVRRQ